MISRDAILKKIDQHRLSEAVHAGARQALEGLLQEMQMAEQPLGKEVQSVSGMKPTKGRRSKAS